MQVYIKSEQDWKDFVNGAHIVSYKNKISDYFKKINIAEIEIVSINNDRVTIMKMY